MRMQQSSPSGMPIGRVFAVTCFVATVVGCGEIRAPRTSDTVSKESPLFFEPQQGIDLWNGATPSNLGPLGTGVVIPVCFAVRPHIDPTGKVVCPSQTNQNVDCSGNT